MREEMRGRRNPSATIEFKFEVLCTSTKHIVKLIGYYQGISNFPIILTLSFTFFFLSHCVLEDFIGVYEF
jgi:hypothetical protein